MIMERISIADDIVPVGEFKARLLKWLNSAKKNGRPIIITQNGRPAGVLLSPQEFDRLQHTQLFLNSVTGSSNRNTDRIRGNRLPRRSEIFAEEK